MTKSMNGGVQIEVRPAAPRDVREIAEFHVEVWQETYRGLMAAEYLSALSSEVWEQEWKTSLDRSPQYRTLVARNIDGSFLGFASAETHAGPAGPLSLELHTLNLKPAARGLGLAKRMTNELLGDAPAFLWVVEGNTRAIEFYRKSGFRLTEERRPDPDCGVDDIRMLRGTIE